MRNKSCISFICTLAVMKSYLKGLILPLAVVICLVSSLVLVSAPKADAAGGLVAQYKLNGDFKDASGSGNDGTLVGDVSFADDSVVGKCAVFNGGYIDVKSSPGLNLGSKFTVSVWVMVDPSMTVPNNKWGGIISKTDDGKGYNNYSFCTVGTKGAKLSTRTNAGERSIAEGPFTNLGLSGSWSQLVFSGDGQYYYLYQNGAQIFKKEVGSGISILSSDGDMRIGSGDDINTKNIRFKGRMADLRVYNYTLSPDEIKTLYSSGVNTESQKPTVPNVTTPASPNPAVTPSSPNSVNVMINGQPLVSDVKPLVNEDGRTMLPVRAIAEALGAQVQWNGPTQTATLSQGTRIVKVTIGQNEINVNGSPVPMDTAAVVNEGRTLLPVRAVGEAFGAQIGWDAGTKTVSIAAPLTEIPFIDLGYTPWTGTWMTNWGKMVLTQNSNTVTGTYEYDSGKITGTVVNGVLNGTWSESPSYSPPGDAGDIIFTMSSDGNSFSGQWRYGSEGSYSTWTGTRQPAVSESTDPATNTDSPHPDKGEPGKKTGGQEPDIRPGA